MEKKCKAILKDKHGSVWGKHIFIPSEISDYFRKNEVKRLVCTLNETQVFHCALMPDGKNRFFINVNSEIFKKLKINIGDEVQVTLIQDESKYGMPMPEEFQEILYQDDEVHSIFEKLTPGKQRSLLYMIGKPKSEATRLKKAIVIAEYLKDCHGSLDYKELNQAFKIYNSR